MGLAVGGLLGLALATRLLCENPREAQSLQGIMPKLVLSPPPHSMRLWQPKWVRSPISLIAPQFYFIVYDPGTRLGDDIRFLNLDPQSPVPERASDYLTYLILADRERGDRHFFTRRELANVLRGHWRDFMGLWYPMLEKAGLMACGMQISEAYQYGINPRHKGDSPPAHAQ